MRPDGVVVPPPLLDDNSRLFEAVEDLPVEQLVTQLAVEALVVAVLPGLPGSMNRVWVPICSSQVRTWLEVISGP